MLNKALKITAVVALALSLSACATNTKNSGTGNNGATTGTNNGTGTNDGTNGGTNAGNNTNGANNGVTTQGLGNNTMNNAGNQQLQMDERMATAIADMNEVSAATVFLTERNAYVAVTLNRGLRDGGQAGRAAGMTNRNGIGNRSAAGNDTFGVTDGVKSKIAATVKQMNPQIRNVYVSANPDFVSRMQGYADHLRNGHPVRGMMLEINRMFDRMFPDNVMNNNNMNNNRNR